MMVRTNWDQTIFLMNGARLKLFRGAGLHSVAEERRAESDLVVTPSSEAASCAAWPSVRRSARGTV